jgi:hypothetical protein
LFFFLKKISTEMKLFYFLLLLSFTLVYCKSDWMYPWMYLEPYGSNVLLKPLKPESYNGSYDSYIQQFSPLGIYILDKTLKIL